MKGGLLISVGLIIVAFFLISSNFTYYAGDYYWDTDRAGFLSGLAHGILAPIMLVVSIFTDYQMYELNNSGWFYNLSFLLGLLFVWGGGSQGTKYIVKNYYGTPDIAKKQSPMKLSENDHIRIEKAVEKKVQKKLKEHEKSEKIIHTKEEKPMKSILLNLLNRNKKKKSK